MYEPHAPVVFFTSQPLKEQRNKNKRYDLFVLAAFVISFVVIVMSLPRVIVAPIVVASTIVVMIIAIIVAARIAVIVRIAAVRRAVAVAGITGCAVRVVVAVPARRVVISVVICVAVIILPILAAGFAV